MPQVGRKSLIAAPSDLDDVVLRRPRMRKCVVQVQQPILCGGADKNLDWFYAASPRLTRYSIGLREPREILIRFSLYQRM